MSKMMTALTAAAMSAGILLCSAAFATREAPAEGPAPAGEHRGPGGPGGHGHGRGGPFMHELRSLNLSDAQKEQVRALFDAKRGQNKPDRTAMHELHRQFEAAIPGTAAYTTLTTQVADAEATAARERVSERSELRAQVYALLTDAQRKQLAQEIANRPEPPARKARKD